MSRVKLDENVPDAVALIQYENAVTSPDGRILALGTNPSTAELVRFDERTRQFVPMLPRACRPARWSSRETEGRSRT